MSDAELLTHLGPYRGGMDDAQTLRIFRKGGEDIAATRKKFAEDMKLVRYVKCSNVQMPLRDECLPPA